MERRRTLAAAVSQRARLGGLGIGRLSRSAQEPTEADGSTGGLMPRPSAARTSLQAGEDVNAKGARPKKKPATGRLQGSRGRVYSEEAGAEASLPAGAEETSPAGAAASEVASSFFLSHAVRKTANRAASKTAYFFVGVSPGLTNTAVRDNQGSNCTDRPAY